MSSTVLEAEQYFSQQFEKDLLDLGAEVFSKYAPVVASYNKIVIPFEKWRTQEQQSIIF